MDWLGDSESGAVFSPCKLYRYTLWRRWSESLWAPHEERLVAFIGLNPSTATETKNDPTIRRLINFAKRDGFDGMVMLNLFAWRSTDPNEMKRAEYPVGLENDAAIREIAAQVDRVVACWGNHGKHANRSAAVIEMLAGIDLLCFGANANGEPVHPLYQPDDAQMIPLIRK